MNFSIESNRRITETETKITNISRTLRPYSELRFSYRWLHVRYDHSRSFSRRFLHCLIYALLPCRFPRYSGASKFNWLNQAPILIWAPMKRIPFEFRRQTYLAKNWDAVLVLSEKPHDSSFSRIVLFLALKDFWKLVKTWQSYWQNLTPSVWDTVYILISIA